MLTIVVIVGHGSLWLTLVNYGSQCWLWLSMVDYGWSCWVCLTTLYYGIVALKRSSFQSQVDLLCSLMVVSQCDVHQGLSHIVMFLKGYVGLWCSPMIMSHCDIHIHSIMFKLQHSSMVMSYFDVYQGVFHLVTFFKGYVSMQHCSWMVMMHVIFILVSDMEFLCSEIVMSHCDSH